MAHDKLEYAAALSILATLIVLGLWAVIALLGVPNY